MYEIKLSNLGLRHIISCIIVEYLDMSSVYYLSLAHSDVFYTFYNSIQPICAQFESSHTWVCSICYKRFRFGFELNNHISVAHLDLNQNLEVDYRIGRNVMDMTMLLANIPSPILRDFYSNFFIIKNGMYRCSFCLLNFVSIKALHSHYDVYHTKKNLYIV